jgi:hypothetical protein
MNILFHHIPKCAGTYLAYQFKHALHHNLKRFFSEHSIKEYIPFNSKFINNLEVLKQNKTIQNAQYIPCIHIDECVTDTTIYSHEFDKQADILLDNPEWLKVLSVRNPVDRFFSSYAQRQRNNCIDNTSTCTDLYQFYFFYREWCRDSSVLELSEDTAKEILNKSISYLKLFDHIFDQSNISEKFKHVFNKQVLIDINNSNITESDYVLNIKYSNITKYCRYIDYDYEFYNAAIKYE